MRVGSRHRQLAGLALVAASTHAACTETILRVRVHESWRVALQTAEATPVLVLPAAPGPARGTIETGPYQRAAERSASGDIAVGGQRVVRADGAFEPMLRNGSGATSRDLVTAMQGDGVAGGVFRMPFWSCASARECRQLVLTTPATNVREIREERRASGVTAFITFTVGTGILVFGTTVLSLALASGRPGDAGGSGRVALAGGELAAGAAIDLGELLYLIRAPGATTRRLDAATHARDVVPTH